jgi:nitrogen regulatory protein P-II 1
MNATGEANMNKIEAIIRPEMLNAVKDALADAGLVGLNVTQVTGRGSQKGIMSPGPRGVGTSYVVEMLAKVKLELVVSDEQTQKAIEIICEHARTGNIGDGKIFISPVANAIRIRTNEQGDKAL